MDLGLRDKVALVCGASQGIGFAVAEELAREGARLAICSRDAAAVDAARARLATHGGEVLAIAADLSSDDGIRRVVEATTARYSHVDVLVTNTGGPPVGQPMGHDWSAWTRAIELLLRSAVELTRAFVPGMRERKWGRVVGITSRAVKEPVPGLVLSNSVRAAVTGYFRTLADEVAVDGVTVNTVLPGFVDTERLRSLADSTAKAQGTTREAVYEKYRTETPSRRVGVPGEIAAVVAFLASTRAAFVTGQAILADGGSVRSLL